MRGCERRVLYLKNCESKLFDEAYFVLRKNTDTPPCANDMLEEATRIIRAETTSLRAPRKKKSALSRSFLPFLAGIAVSATICAVLVLL